MQRPRNRQNRPQQQQSSRGRGGNNFRNNTRAPSGSVPRATQVVPGAAVSIVLKVDQPTGRELQGFVAECLTRGDHPRGIKVRLADGRVGRVQRMVTDEEAKTASEGMSGLGRNGESANVVATGAPSTSTASMSRFTHRYHDIRQEEGLSVPSGYDLDAFLPIGHPLRAAPDRNAQPASPANEHNPGSTATQTCPVCGEFEGDEIAVAHHVNEHFD